MSLKSFWFAAVVADCSAPFEVVGEVRGGSVGLVVVENVPEPDLVNATPRLGLELCTRFVSKLDELHVSHYFSPHLEEMGRTVHLWGLDQHPQQFVYYHLTQISCVPQSDSPTRRTNINIDEGERNVGGLLTDLTVPTARKFCVECERRARAFRPPAVAVA